MAIDPRYIPAFSLEEVFLDKDTGAPLAGGKVYFQRDSQPQDTKFVYQITGTDPNYSYIALPNPMILSSIGTFEDSLGNPVVPYFLPYIGVEDDPDYYLVRVLSSGDVPQFERRPVPYIPGTATPDSNVSTFTNQLSNPQFEEVLFDTSTPSFVYNFGAGVDQVQNIAPNWDIVISCLGAATVTVKQITTTLTGQLNVETNPGALLEITSAGLTSLRLRQRLYGSPNLWGSDYLSGTFTGRTTNSTVTAMTMYYSQSNGSAVDQEVATGNFPADGSYETIKGNIELPVSTSVDFYPDAYVEIYIDIPVSASVQITSVMVAGTGRNAVDNIVYEQTSTNRQIDQLFHYYKPQLEYKPIPSYLVGWDFHLNPAQCYKDAGDFNTPALGANKSRYIWDQTIGFQTTANSLSFDRDTTTGGLKLGILPAATSGKIALIQYIEGNQAREILSQRNALQMKAKVSSNTLNGSISLFWTDDVSLPVLTAGTDNSLVSAITGVIPTAGNGTWTAVPNTNLGNNALFTLTTSYQTFDFVGFDASATAAPTSATFMAVVIVFDTLTNPDEIVLQYCSLNGGDIATRPAPQTKDDVLKECQYYYELSNTNFYNINVNPSVNALLIEQNSYNSIITQTAQSYATPFCIQYQNIKRVAPSLTLYSAFTGGTTNNVLPQLFYITNTAAFSAPTGTDINWTDYWTASVSDKLAYFRPYSATKYIIATSGGGNSSNITNYASAGIRLQYVADARLGLF